MFEVPWLGEIVLQSCILGTTFEGIIAFYVIDREKHKGYLPI